MENWKPVVGFEGVYEVSDLGRVRSVVKRRNSYNGKILVPRIRETGYHQYSLTKEGRTRYFKGARIVATAFIPNPENKSQVNHINGIKSDDRAENLEWATPSENQIHAIRMGLSHPVKGDKHKMSILRAKDIPQIRQLLANGEHPEDIAPKFGVRAMTIRDVQYRRTWRSVD